MRGSSRKPALQQQGSEQRKQPTGQAGEILSTHAVLQRPLLSAEGEGTAVGVLPGGGDTIPPRPSPRKNAKSDAVPNASTTLLHNNSNNQIWSDAPPPQYRAVVAADPQRQPLKPYKNGSTTNYYQVSNNEAERSNDNTRSNLAYYGSAGDPYATQYGTDFGIRLADHQYAAQFGNKPRHQRDDEDTSPWRRAAATPTDDAELLNLSAQPARHLLRYNGGSALPPPATTTGNGKNKNVKFCVTVEDDLNVEAEL